MLDLSLQWNRKIVCLSHPSIRISSPLSIPNSDTMAIILFLRKYTNNYDLCANYKILMIWCGAIIYDFYHDY